MRSGKRKAPKAAATAKGANIAGVETNEVNEGYHGQHPTCNDEDVIFQFHVGFKLWRLQIHRYKGRLICNFRKWVPFRDGYRPTRQGVTIPIELLPELCAALALFLGSGVGDSLTG